MLSKEKIKNIPNSCGVYIMRDKENKILYIGKAVSLKKRIMSYFSNKTLLKTEFLLEEVNDIEYIECNSQEQALLLEAALIKENKPKYNVVFRDDKIYPYVEITKELFPRVFISRPRDKKEKILFGPFPKVNLIKSALVLIRKIFPYRSCKNMPKKACLYFHLNLCPAPCIGKISSEDYRENINSICKILSGDRLSLIEDLKNKIEFFSSKQEFEKAKLLRDKLFSLEAIYKGKTYEHDLLALKKILGLNKIPLVIEGIDISSISGKVLVGSVVRFKGSVPDKSNYRRYRIKEVNKNDDYACIAEVVKRRYKRLIIQNDLPDLIIIDGGLGHLNIAKKELDNLGLDIPIIAIAKKNEEIYKDSLNPILIPKDNPALHLIQKVRDEAHRFAHKYHLLLRSKNIKND